MTKKDPVKLLENVSDDTQIFLVDEDGIKEFTPLDFSIKYASDRLKDHYIDSSENYKLIDVGSVILG